MRSASGKSTRTQACTTESALLSGSLVLKSAILEKQPRLSRLESV
jgi:hypothetical protein